MIHRHYDAGPICNDDPRQFHFVRSSGIPLGTFPRRERRRWPSVDRVVVWAIVVCGVASLFIP